MLKMGKLRHQRADCLLLREKADQSCFPPTFHVGSVLFTKTVPVPSVMAGLDECHVIVQLLYRSHVSTKVGKDRNSFANTCARR